MTGFSYPEGKDLVCAWIREHFPTESSILDVGAGGGTWRKLLPEYPHMDAVEIYQPTVAEITGMYRAVICGDVRVLSYRWYDLIIFGDVIEHMDVADARKVLAYARERCRDCIVAVPWMLVQGAIYGNLYEIHIQDDLTPRIFAERYPGFEAIYISDKYAYYHKAEE